MHAAMVFALLFVNFESTILALLFSVKYSVPIELLWFSNVQL